MVIHRTQVRDQRQLAVSSQRLNGGFTLAGARAIVTSFYVSDHPGLASTEEFCTILARTMGSPAFAQIIGDAGIETLVTAFDDIHQPVTGDCLVF